MEEHTSNALQAPHQSTSGAATPTEIPVEETQALILQEAQKILRGETMMLPTRKHLEALARLNEELVKALRVWKYYVNADEARIAALAKVEGQ